MRHYVNTNTATQDTTTLPSTSGLELSSKQNHLHKTIEQNVHSVPSPTLRFPQRDHFLLTTLALPTGQSPEFTKSSMETAGEKVERQKGGE